MVRSAQLGGDCQQDAARHEQRSGDCQWRGDCASVTTPQKPASTCGPGGAGRRSFWRTGEPGAKDSVAQIAPLPDGLYFDRRTSPPVRPALDGEGESTNCPVMAG